jgi:hypothetical protein
LRLVFTGALALRFALAGRAVAVIGAPISSILTTGGISAVASSLGQSASA